MKVCMFKKIIFFTATLCVACSTDESIIEDYQGIEALVSIPDNFPDFVDDVNNPLTEEGVLLGEKLFFDKRLSGTNKVACATCHLPERSFSDGVALSTNGVSAKKLLRNSPALINLAWANNGLFWDGGSKNLESQAFAPLAHQDEMFQDLEELVQELNYDKNYTTLFYEAFNEPINQTNIVKAIAQYERTLIFSNSKYDKYIRNEGEVVFTHQELKGLNLATQHCFSCHVTPLFTDHQYHNNGIDDDFNDNSHDGMFQGRYRVSFDEKDIGAYRTPTLRNIDLTAPYMHDGRFTTLKEVVNHYSSNIKNSSSLANELLLTNSGFKFTNEEKEALISFLKTLTNQ